MNFKLLKENARHAFLLSSQLIRRGSQGPSMLVFFVTSRCGGACKHCFDWQRRGEAYESSDLTLKEIETVAGKLPRPYFMIVTGGEPFIREDIVRIAEVFIEKTRPRVLAIPTNGQRTEFIIESVNNIIQHLPKEVFLSLNVSIDGVGRLHDEIRGVGGMFVKAEKTVKGLQRLAAETPNFGVGVVTVVSSYNQDHLNEIMEYVLDELRLPIWSPFLARGNPRNPDSLNVDIERYADIAEKLEKRISAGTYGDTRGFIGARMNSSKNVVRRRIIEGTIKEKRRLVSCAAGRMIATVYSDGSVYPCEILNEPMGNLRDYNFDFNRLWKSEAAQNTRAKIRLGNCYCTHENAMTMSIPYDWHQWPALARWFFSWKT